MPDPIQRGPEPTPGHVAAVTDIARSVMRGLMATGLPHAVQLDGALSAYASLLVQHPCCWTTAAAGLRDLADQIDRMHLAQAAAAAEQAGLAIATAARKPA